MRTAGCGINTMADRRAMRVLQGEVFERTTGATMGTVPKAMRGKYDEIAAIIVPYCDDYLDDEYKELCLHALERLSRKRPSPLLNRRPGTWAAGIIYAVGQANWIFDKSQPIHTTAEELVGPLGVSKSTASSTAAEIRKWLNIDYFSAEWTLPSQMVPTWAPPSPRPGTVARWTRSSRAVSRLPFG